MLFKPMDIYNMADYGFFGEDNNETIMSSHYDGDLMIITDAFNYWLGMYPIKLPQMYALYNLATDSETDGIFQKYRNAFDSDFADQLIYWSFK